MAQATHDEIEREHCPVCAGTGEVLVGERNVNGAMRPRYGRCPDCDGTGEVAA